MTTPLVVSVTDEMVAELEALAGNATPGPWNYDGSYVCTMRKEGGTTYVESWNTVADARLSKNVHYIAAANPATILALLAERAELKRDAERLAFMLLKHRKVVIERLPRNQTEVYVEEGFMSDRKYPAVSMTGEWVNDSPEALLLRKQAIDLAMNESAA